MKKILSFLLAALLLLSVLPVFSSAAEASFGWKGDGADFGPWKLTDGCNVQINPDVSGNRRIWRQAVTDTGNFSVTLTCTVLTGRAYVNFMGAVVELNRDGGGTDYLFTNVDRQWFYASGYTATVTFSRTGGGPMSVCISGKGGSGLICKDFAVSASPNTNLYLGTYEQTASASFREIRSVSGRSSDWTAMSNYWSFNSYGGAVCDNKNGTAAVLGTSGYFTGAFTLSFRIDFTKFYMENRIGSVRVGLCGALNDGVPVLFDVMAENNGKNTFSLSYLQNETWNSCGVRNWNDGDAGRFDNSYYVEISRNTADEPLVFSLLRSDRTTPAGDPMTLEGMLPAGMDALHAVRMEFYNCACICSEFRLSVRSGSGEIPGWEADTTCFSARSGAGILAFGSEKTAYKQTAAPSSDTYCAYASFSFGSGDESRRLILADAENNEIATAVVRKSADGHACVTLEKNGAAVKTVPETYGVRGMNGRTAVLRLTKLQGKDSLILSLDDRGLTAAEAEGLDAAARIGVAADTACVFSDTGLRSYAPEVPMTRELAQTAERGDGILTPDIPFSIAVQTYENLMTNYLDAGNNRLYPVEGGYRDGFVLPDGRTVRVDRAGELWEAYILLCAMDTYAQMLKQGSPEWEETARRIANTLNFFTDAYTEEELTTAGTSPCNHAMDDSGWCCAALILGYRYNLALGDTGNAALQLNRAVKLFHSIYDTFYDDTLGGGTWYSRGKEGKSLYAAMTALDGWDLLQITADASIEAEMLDIYNGLENTLRRSDGLYWCGLRYTGYEGIGNPYGINEAGSVSFLGCNMAMAVMNARLGNTEKAKETAAGLSLYETTAAGVYINDRDAWVNAVFAGQWARELLNTGILGDAYCETLRRTAASILNCACLPDGYYSPAWSGPCDPSADGFPENWEDEISRWGKAGNGTVPRQMMTSATTAHMILAAAALSETPASSPGEFGWRTDSADYSGWIAKDRWNLCGTYENQENHRLWTEAVPAEGPFSLTADFSVDGQSSVWLKVCGVTLELDGRHGTGQQAYVKLDGAGLDWLDAANGTVHAELTAGDGGLSVTLWGKENGTPMTLTAARGEPSELLEIGLFAGRASVRNLRVLLPECEHEYEKDGTLSVPAACLEPGKDVYVCGKCGASYEESLQPLGHDYLDHAAKAPACAEPGWEAYRTCSRCDYTTYREIPALGHVFVDGVCERCGEPDPDYTDPCAGYSDLDKSKWYYSAAAFVIENGYMGSTSTEKLTFEPMTGVSRAMVVSIMYRIAGSPAAEYKASFADVPDGKWFTGAAEWCAQNGLASGKGSGKFDPSGKVTRQELASFMMRLSAFRGGDTAGRADLGVFPDAGAVPSWAAAAVSWAVDAGILSGKASGGVTRLAPEDNAVRAELASILMRFCAD